MRGKVLGGVGATVVVFLLLAGGRWAFGPAAFPGAQVATDPWLEADFDLGQVNYANEKSLAANVQDAAGRVVVQAYEKVASILSRTRAFSTDERLLRQAIARRGGVVQLERSSGLRGERHLRLGIGVRPEEFDALVGEIRRIGRLASIRIERTDRTDEYRRLGARRASLEKARASLADLKRRGGDVDGLLAVEERLLSLEQELQTLGVTIDAFEVEDGLCTVKATLVEETPPPARPLGPRLLAAARWATLALGITLGLLLLAAATTLLALRLRERLSRRGPST